MVENLSPSIFVEISLESLNFPLDISGWGGGGGEAGVSNDAVCARKL